MPGPAAIRSCATQTVWTVFEAERSSLVLYVGRFNRFHAVAVPVSKTCLVRFDNNRCSISAHAVERPVEVRAYDATVARFQTGVDTCMWCPVLSRYGSGSVGRPGLAEHRTAKE